MFTSLTITSTTTSFCVIDQFSVLGASENIVVLFWPYFYKLVAFKCPNNSISAFGYYFCTVWQTGCMLSCVLPVCVCNLAASNLRYLDTSVLLMYIVIVHVHLLILMIFG